MIRISLRRNSEVIKIKHLRKSIFDKKDLILFDEALKCFENEAYRASLILIWICTAASLRNKFKDMAVHDSEIGKIVKEIEKMERQEKSTDRFILQKSLEIGVISSHEYFEKLDHIRNMRNLYAHPIGKKPEIEEVIASFVLSVNIVLSFPSRLRHGYVEKIIKSLFEDRHFLDDDDSKIKEYGLVVANRIDPDVLPFLFKKLSEGLEKIFDDPEFGIFKKRCFFFGVTLLKKLKPDLSHDNWNIITMIQNSPKSMSLLISIPDIWISLSGRVKDMCFSHLIEPVLGIEIKPPTGFSLRRAITLSKEGLLTGRQKEKLDKSMKKVPCITLKLAGIHLREYADIIISDLKSYNWYVQNPAIIALKRAGIDECSQLDPSVQKQLGRNVLQSAQGGAGESEFFISSILNRKEIWSKFFIEGLLLETLVNDNCKFRLKEIFFEDVVKITLLHPSIVEIINCVIKEIKSSKMSRFCKIDDYYVLMDILKKVISETDSHSILLDLIKSIDIARKKAEFQPSF